ncbi:MAG TPA: methyltransferase domain-containing protein [Alphaproteobacteria bacterium]|nr:methyltransferase domain-containing protein [Alphaproteobacteria bacterium]
MFSAAPIYDDLSLWSAPFGLALLDTVRLRRGITVVDIGTGGGFPLIELAKRLDPASTFYGIDPDNDVLDLARAKATALGLTNIHLLPEPAEHIALADSSVDLIVSNNGINNVADAEQVLRECVRIARPGAQMVLTVNLPETMHEFYSVFAAVLRDLSLTSEIQAMRDHIYAKRKPLATTEAWIRAAGFTIASSQLDSFTLNYLDGTAFFKHQEISLYFLPPWREVVKPEHRERVFSEIENRLNQQAQQRGELRMTIPLVCIDCRK